MTMSGQCACGNVKYEVSGATGVVSCHCKMCQRLHGNYNPMMVADKQVFKLVEENGLAWFDSSAEARRGFCKECGSALFKEQKTGPKILVAVGSLDETHGLKNVKNVFSEEAGEYYVMPPEIKEN